MSLLLLDTNVVSELWRRQPDRAVVDRLQALGTARLRLSVIVIAELRRGVEAVRRRDRRQAAALELRLTGVLEEYADRIVPIDQAIAERWGRLMEPDPVPDMDGLLAATALVNDWTLVTRNVRDFERTGVRLLNPFTA